MQAYDPEAVSSAASDAKSAAVNLDEYAETIVANESASSTASLSPGNIIIDANLEGPTTTSTSPNVPVAVIQSPATTTDSARTPWLMWFVGGGLALLIGLLMFGRRLRSDDDRSPEAPIADQTHNRRYTDLESTDTENIAAADVDFDLSDDSPTEENLALDADLIIGTGLAVSAENDSTQDFAFAATTNLDIELPFEPEAAATEETDMLPPLRTDEHSILDSEVMPEDEDDYDMSVIVDATKMPQPEDVTERDLKAVEVAHDEDTLIAQNYTISKEVDYKVLEQDYEDEFSSTQALNEEIAKAAAELAGQLDDSDESNDEQTAALPLATVTELDVTAQMPAQNDDISDPDVTQETEVTVNMDVDDATAEMPVGKDKAG